MSTVFNLKLRSIGSDYYVDRMICGIFPLKNALLCRPEVIDHAISKRDLRYVQYRRLRAGRLPETLSKLAGIHFSESAIASLPACAHCSSWSPLAPLTPIPPMKVPSALSIGNPPANTAKPGTGSMLSGRAGFASLRSPNARVERGIPAEVRPFSCAILMLCR